MSASKVSFPSTASRAQHDTWTLPKDAGCKNRMICIIIGVVLTAMASVATYFCLVHGLTMLDYASTSLLQFGAGFLIYSGVTFSIVAAGNALYLGGKQLCHDEDKKFEYTPKEAKWQIALSVFAPIAAIPGVIILGLGTVFRR